MSEIGSCFTSGDWNGCPGLFQQLPVQTAYNACLPRDQTFAVSTLHSSNRDHPLPHDRHARQVHTRHDRHTARHTARHIFPLDYDIEVALAAESMSALHQSCANIDIITTPAAATSAQFYPSVAPTRSQQRSHSQPSNATRALLSRQKSSRMAGRKARTMKQRARVLVLRCQQEIRALLHCLPVRTHHQTRTSRITPQHRSQN